MYIYLEGTFTKGVGMYLPKILTLKNVKKIKNLVQRKKGGFEPKAQKNSLLDQEIEQRDFTFPMKGHFFLGSKFEVIYGDFIVVKASPIK